MKKLLLSLGSSAIFGIGITTSSLNLFEVTKSTENNISKINKKVSNSEKENISQESTFESSCCPEILNN
jgi:hypothetical protein